MSEQLRCADKACSATKAAACRYPSTEGGWPGHCVRSTLLAQEEAARDECTAVSKLASS